MQVKIYRVNLVVDIEANNLSEVRYLLREILESSDEENRKIKFEIKEIKLNKRKTKELERSISKVPFSF